MQWGGTVELDADLDGKLAVVSLAGTVTGTRIGVSCGDTRAGS